MAIFTLTGAQFLLGLFTFGDVDHSTCEFDEIAARAENRMTDDANVPDFATLMHDAVFRFKAFLLTDGPLGQFNKPRSIVGMNRPEECFGSGQTIPWIETQNSVAFLRPVSDVLIGTPGKTARVPEPLRFRQVRFTYSDLFLGALLFAQVEDVDDALVGTLKARASNQHGYAAAVLPEVLLLVMKNASFKELCQGTFVALAPFGRRQVRPAQSTRDDILTVVLQQL